MYNSSFHCYFIFLLTLCFSSNIIVSFEIESCNSNKIDHVKWLEDKSVIRYGDLLGIKPGVKGANLDIWCDSYGSLISSCKLERLDSPSKIACQYSTTLDNRTTTKCQTSYNEFTQRIKPISKASNQCRFHLDLLTKQGKYLTN